MDVELCKFFKSIEELWGIIFINITGFLWDRSGPVGSCWFESFQITNVPYAAQVANSPFGSHLTKPTFPFSDVFLFCTSKKKEKDDLFYLSDVAVTLVYHFMLFKLTF